MWVCQLLEIEEVKGKAIGPLEVHADVKRESRLDTHSNPRLGHLFLGLETLGVNMEVQPAYDL